MKLRQLASLHPLRPEIGRQNYEQFRDVARRNAAARERTAGFRGAARFGIYPRTMRLIM